MSKQDVIKYISLKGMSPYKGDKCIKVTEVGKDDDKGCSLKGMSPYKGDKCIKVTEVGKDDDKGCRGSGSGSDSSTSFRSEGGGLTWMEVVDCLITLS